MFGLKLITLITLSSSIFGGGGASGCRAKQKQSSQSEKPLKPVGDKDDISPEDLKILAEGFHSSITNSFVVVVRDAETYAALLKLDGNLPKLDQEFFKSNVVIAAFLGERNTGGYRVDISREVNGEIRIAEKVPGKGVMVPQMITAPSKVVSLPVAGGAPLLLSLDNAWRKNLRMYHVTNGRFTMSGGFAGEREAFGLEGDVRVLCEGNLATFAFDIVGSGPGRKHSLMDFATGVIQKDGGVAIQKLSAGSLVSPPNSGLKATGAFSLGYQKLSLILVSLPLMIADGYSGQGSIEAGRSESTDKP
jgi:hypothetical protein